MTLKSAAVLLCIALLVAGLAACGSDDPSPSEDATPSATNAPAERTVTATPSAVATPAPETPTPTPSPSPTPSAYDPDTAVPFDPKVVRGTLSNGLAYYIRRNEEPRERAHLSLVVKAGSVVETEEQRGLAHFVEHMAFNGTERFAKQEIVDYLESIGSTFGADLNGATGYDMTFYWLEIPTDDPEILETAFQILSDWAFAVSFDPEEVELERKVVLEEWRLAQGFTSRWQDSLLPLIFGDSRYTDRNVIGLTEVIETAPVEQLRAYYERWYRPDLMALVAVGDFDTDLIEAKVKQHFAPPPEGGAVQERAAVAPPTDRPTFEVPDHDEPRVDIFTDPEAPGTQLTLVLKLEPETGQDMAAVRRGVAEGLAFAMLNARLFERGEEADPPYLWAVGSRGSFVETLDVATFAVVVEPDGIEDGFAALLEEMQRAGQHGFTAGELDREKATLLSSVESTYKQRDQQQSGSLAQSYWDHFLSGRPVPGIEARWELYQQIVPLISLEEVAAVADSWTQPGNTVLLVLRPETPGSTPDDELGELVRTQLVDSRVSRVEAYDDTFEDVPLLETIPTPGTITAEEQIQSIDAVRWTLSNGITVIARQTDFRNDEVLFTAYSPGGHSLVADADHVSALYAAYLVDGSGAGPHDGVTLDKLLAGKRVAVSPYIGELFEGLSGSASPEDLETLFQLITLYATKGRIDPDYFDTYQTRLRTVAETRASQPDAVLFDTADTVLGQNHLRRRPLTVELLEELSLDRAEAVYTDRFADLGDATFIFVGAFDWEELRDLTTTYLASLPTTGRSEAWLDLGIRPPGGVEDHTVHIGIEPRSVTVLVHTGDMEWSRPEALTLDVAGEMLAIRLRERVREELGGSYSINVQVSSGLLPYPRYQVAIIFGSDPARADELAREVAAEVEWLRSGAEQRYLDTAREVFRTNREEQLRTNSFWLNQIRAAAQRGEPFIEINGFDESLDALTLEDVVAVAKRYLLAEEYVRIVVLPEEE